MKFAACVAAAIVVLAACEKKQFERPDRAEQVAEADSLFSTAMFDTIQWVSPEQRLAAGNDVFAVHCRRCHGPLGQGDMPYARERNLAVPSLAEPDWRYHGDTEAVRRRIFTGHPGGMPTWGIAGITPREIDAVAHYIVEQLRPDAAAARGRAAGGTAP
jgi:mono/diheme cytochrome c family protein